MAHCKKWTLKKHNAHFSTFASQKKHLMKYILSIILSSSLLFACTSNDVNSVDKQSVDSAKRAQQLNAATDSANFTQIQWIDSIHQDLGKVNEGGVVEVSWRFKNTGNKPLIISNVSASCGCTVADKPEAPVVPGEEGTIKAKFDSKDRQGMQRKDVYVLANTSGVTNHQLSFAVDVQKK